MSVFSSHRKRSFGAEQKQNESNKVEHDNLSSFIANCFVFLTLSLQFFFFLTLSLQIVFVFLTLSLQIVFCF